MSARDKQKWLTPHALRSGLKEQYATEVKGETVIVELSWHKASGGFMVAIQYPTYKQHVLTDHDLARVRRTFTAQRRKVQRPTLEGESA